MYSSSTCNTKAKITTLDHLTDDFKEKLFVNGVPCIFYEYNFLLNLIKIFMKS